MFTVNQGATPSCPDLPFIILLDVCWPPIVPTTSVIIIIIMINLIYIAQFDSDGILTALYIII